MKAMYRILMTALVLLALSVVPALAQDTDPDEDVDGPVSALDHPTQATIAEGLAAAATQQAIETAEANLKRAQDTYDAAEAAALANPADVAAQEAFSLAGEALAAAQAANEAALAGAADVTAEQVADMRAAGMGWGDIAHALGVHPSTIGQSVSSARHAAKAGFSKEQASMTARNTAKGKSDSSASSAGKGNGNAGGGNGNAGGNGNGNGNGDGNGKGGGNAGGNGKGGGKK